MNRYTLVTAAIAIVLIAMFWNQPQLKAGRHYLARLALDGTEPTPTPTPTLEVERPRFDKCIDGSALTVTSRDSDRTYYRCESGAVGSYLN
jgi:hypothetical protein